MFLSSSDTLQCVQKRREEHIRTDNEYTKVMATNLLICMISNDLIT